MVNKHKQQYFDFQPRNFKQIVFVGNFFIVLSMTIKNTYSAREAMRLCGYETIAMIDYLQRSGVFFKSSAEIIGQGQQTAVRV